MQRETFFVCFFRALPAGQGGFRVGCAPPLTPLHPPSPPALAFPGRALHYASFLRCAPAISLRCAARNAIHDFGIYVSFGPEALMFCFPGAPAISLRCAARNAIHDSGIYVSFGPETLMFCFPGAPAVSLRYAARNAIHDSGIYVSFRPGALTCCVLFTRERVNLTGCFRPEPLMFCFPARSGSSFPSLDRGVDALFPCLKQFPCFLCPAYFRLPK